MSRITQQESAERYKFMLGLFKKDPQLSIPKANKKVMGKFGAQINAQKAYELRQQARTQVEAGKDAGSQQQAAARHQGKRKPQVMNRSQTQMVTGEHRNQLLIIEGTTENIAWFRTVTEALQKAGVANLEIDHQTDSYAVIKA